MRFIPTRQKFRAVEKLQKKTAHASRSRNFKHALLREVACEAVLKCLRHTYHKPAAAFTSAWNEGKTIPLEQILKKYR
jgi:hypothetical protein